MNVLDRVGFCLLLSALCFIHPPLHAQTTQQSTPANAGGGVVREGLHDFDPLVGRWKYHLKRRLNPLSGIERVGRV